MLRQRIAAEKKILKLLEKYFGEALAGIGNYIALLLGRQDANLPNVINRIEYQRMIKAQVQAALDKLHAKEYETIETYLQESYTDAFVGTMYSLHAQDVPIIVPIDQNMVIKAISIDTKLKAPLYKTLGMDLTALKNTIASEITRGVASGMLYSDMQRNIANATRMPLSRARLIVRTEAGRIQEQATMDAAEQAKAKGADVVKQWSAILDGATRENHRLLDHQVRELEELFEVGNKKAKHPHGFGDPAEDCNCRCTMLVRARAALDEEELEEMQKRASFHGLAVKDSKAFGHAKAKDFSDFKKKYLKVTEDWASADASVKKHLGVDARDELDKIVERGTTKIKQGFSAFSKDDILYERIKLVEPDGNKFDVGMHGTPSAVAFGGTEANMSPRLLASIIRHSPGYHGQEIRLLSCSTGRIVDDEYCFAEELANALGVTVYAPNDLLLINESGIMCVGRFAQGSFVSYKPNERKRLK